MQPTTTDQLYNIDYIIKEKNIHNSKMYKVKWEGYPLSQSTWEPLTAIRHTQPYIDYITKEIKKKPAIAKSRVEDVPQPTKRKRIGEYREETPRHGDLEQSISLELKEYDLLEILQSICIRGAIFYFVEAIKKSVGTKRVIITEAKYINSQAPELMKEYEKINK